MLSGRSMSAIPSSEMHVNSGFSGARPSTYSPETRFFLFSLSYKSYSIGRIWNFFPFNLETRLMDEGLNNSFDSISYESMDDKMYKHTLIRCNLSTKHEGGCSSPGSSHVGAIVVRFLAERQLPPLRTSVWDAEVLGPVRPDVFVPRQISSVKIYEEEGEAAHQYTGRAEVVTSFPTATDVHVPCKISPTLNFLFFLNLTLF